jgi:predicted ATPase/DNA-binding XRE family transcriptional regulator
MPPEDHVVGFGGLLRRHRAAAGLSQEALAERASMSRRGVADLERGVRHFPYGDTVRRLADALSLDAAERSVLLAASLRPEARTRMRTVSLPVEASALVGRERELSELQLLLKTVRLLTLTGAGGIGKTRLAVELARRVEAHYEDGAVFVELAPVSDPTAVPHALAAAIGVRETGSSPIVDLIQEFVGAKELLIIVDNCEHLIDACAALADTLLRTCPAIRFLATSREALRSRGETVWPVPSLRQDEASHLFIERARSSRADLQFGPDERKLIEQICRRLDNIPLAIELAAARVPALGVGEIAAHLDKRLHILSTGNRTDSPRHQTLRAAIDWSYELLTTRERMLFQKLAVFAGGWDINAIAPICSLDVSNSHELLDLLANLVDKSLVVSEQRGSTMRYRLLETMREYASERFDASEDAQTARRHHAEYFRKLADAGSVVRRGLRYPRNMDVIRREHENMRAALSCLLTLGDLDNGLALCQALSGYWLSQGYLDEGEEWLRRFMERAEHLSWQARAQCFYIAGRSAEYRGAYEQALSYFESSLASSRDHNNATYTARALFGLGDVAEHQGDFDGAYNYFQEGLALGRDAGILSEVAEALVSSARIEAARGDAANARRHREEALTTQRRLGDAWGIAYVLNDLCQQAREEGQLEMAEVLEEEALALWHECGSRMGVRAASMNLAVITLEQGALARASELAGEMLDLCHEMADASASTVRCLEIAAMVLQALGSAEVAVRLEAAATSQRQVLGAPVPPNERHEREMLGREAEAALGPAAFQRAWRDGGRLSVHQAVELASDSLATVVTARSS